MLRKLSFYAVLLLLAAAAAAALLEAGLPLALAASRAARAPSAGQGGPLNVYVLGESTAAGEPYAPKISFPKTLLAMYGGRLGGRELRLVNLAEPGSDLEQQYWKFFRELALRPPGRGLVLIYAGINEPSPEAPDPAFGRWRLAQRSLLLSRLLAKYPDSGFAALFGERHTLARYEYRLGAALRLARRNGLTPVVSTLTGNFADFPSLTPPRFAREADTAAFARAGRLGAAGRHKEAAALYASLLAGDAGDGSALRYALGRELAAAGDNAGAAEQFRLAADRGWNKRPTSAQNAAIRRAAAAEGAVLADTAALFERSSPHGLVGYNLFLDAHHPDLRGCALLAESFASGVAAATGEAPSRPRFTPAGLRAEFGFTAADEFEALLSRADWFCGEASQPGGLALLPKAEEYLARAEQVCGPRGCGPDAARRLDLARLMVLALRKDGAGAARLLRAGGFLGGNLGLLRNGNPYFETWIHGVLGSAGLPPDVRAELENALRRRR